VAAEKAAVEKAAVAATVEEVRGGS
jgi:hypothetical protein